MLNKHNIIKKPQPDVQYLKFCVPSPVHDIFGERASKRVGPKHVLVHTFEKHMLRAPTATLCKTPAGAGKTRRHRLSPRTQNYALYDI